MKCKTKKRNGLAWQFNPYELAFCGYSNSGKTTLITRLIESLSKKHSLAYIKHDGHKFELDKEGKDTYQAREAGAAAVYINDENKSALQMSHLPEKPYVSLPFLDYDFVLVEGYKKNLKMPKIVILDDSLEILDLYKDQDANVLAYVGSSMAKPKELAEYDLYFQRDQIKEIEALVLDYFAELSNDRPINGLVLVGGYSSRMKTDKASLKYHGLSQAAHSAALLEKYCDEVYLSCREGQELPEDCQQYTRIADSFLNMGLKTAP